MIKIEKIITPSDEQMMFVIQGMRNAFQSWDKSDSTTQRVTKVKCGDSTKDNVEFGFKLGECDKKLMSALTGLGTDERKYLREMPIHMRITAPLYWWKEMDTYKVGVTSLSTSTMHNLCSKPFEWDDFSVEDLKFETYATIEAADGTMRDDAMTAFENYRNVLNAYRDQFLKAQRNGDRDKASFYWRTIVQLLPSSYNQTRNLSMNYEVLMNIYKARKNHKLKEWREFCSAIEQVPYFKEVYSK